MKIMNVSAGSPYNSPMGNNKVNKSNNIVFGANVGGLRRSLKSILANSNANTIFYDGSDSALRRVSIAIKKAQKAMKDIRRYSSAQPEQLRFTMHLAKNGEGKSLYHLYSQSATEQEHQLIGTFSAAHFDAPNTLVEIRDAIHNAIWDASTWPQRVWNISNKAN